GRARPAEQCFDSAPRGGSHRPRGTGSVRITRGAPRRGGQGGGGGGSSGAPQPGAPAPPATPLLLASRSPQRRAILEQLGIPFDVVEPRYEEVEAPELADATQVVREHALGKARSVADEADGRPVLGVDTEVVLQGLIFGKPTDATEAEQMLEERSCKTH